MIGGNIEAVILVQNGSEITPIGEYIPHWEVCNTIRGWLDLSNGDSKYTNDTKLQESTHVFISDYALIDRNARNKRLVVNGIAYDVLLIDDPMEMHQQLEFYLKHLGAVSDG